MNSVRVAAHIHSAWSYDADWQLRDIAGAFRKRGFDVLLMAEHDRSFDQRRWARYRQACAAASTKDMLVVPGIEYEDADGVVHTPVWGNDVPFLGTGHSTLELLRAAKAEGAVAVLAHPWRRNAIARYQPQWAPYLSAVEIWNRKYDGIAPGRRLRAFADKEGLRPFAALDFHERRQLFPLAMTMPLSGPPSADSIVEAIRLGDCRPEFLGVSALRFTKGLDGAVLSALEAVRRGLRGPVRRIQRAIG